MRTPTRAHPCTHPDTCTTIPTHRNKTMQTSVRMHVTLPGSLYLQGEVMCSIHEARCTCVDTCVFGCRQGYGAHRHRPERQSGTQRRGRACRTEGTPSRLHCAVTPVCCSHPRFDFHPRMCVRAMCPYSCIAVVYTFGGTS